MNIEKLKEYTIPKIRNLSDGQVYSNSNLGVLMAKLLKKISFVGQENQALKTKAMPFSFDLTVYNISEVNVRL